ncbi:hypothetical protein C7S17_0731 [Burkholderia thailandensis]|nr:hypothetical protein [Burkholderia thailandensis]
MRCGLRHSAHKPRAPVRPAERMSPVGKREMPRNAMRCDARAGGGGRASPRSDVCVRFAAAFAARS